MGCEFNCVKFQVGFNCNLSCGFCIVQAENKHTHITEEVVDSALSDKNLNLKRVVVTGGEPTMPMYLPTTLSIIRKARSLGAATTIYTNGTLLNNDVLDKLVEAAGDPTQLSIRLSLYLPIDWVWINSTLNNIEAHGIERFLKFTMTREDAHELPNILENLKSLRLHRFQIKPYNRIEIEHVDDKYEMTPNQVLQTSRLLLKYKKLVDFRVDLLPLSYEFLVEDVPVEDVAKCNCGKGDDGYMVINPNGDVFPCGAYTDSIGNVLRAPLTYIWNNSHLLKTIRGLEHSVPDECIDCKHWNICKVNDCHSTTFRKYGNFSRGNPQCPILAMKRFTG